MKRSQRFTFFLTLPPHDRTGESASSVEEGTRFRQSLRSNMTTSVIIGSTRQGRFSEKPALWILQELRKRDRIEARILDLRDFPMPFFDQPMPPAMPGRPPYEHDVVKNWSAQIAASDSFIFVTPEYNYGPSAVLKNAIDWVYPQVEPRGCRVRELRPRRGRTRRAAASRDGHQASNGTDWSSVHI